MLISASDVLGTARVAAILAADKLQNCYDDCSFTKTDYDTVEGRLIQALAEVRAARDMVAARMPQSDGDTVDRLIERYRVPKRDFGI